MEKRDFVCCFTGHRDIMPEHKDRLAVLVDSMVEKMIQAGVITFRAGGAVGFDTLAALTVIEKKKTHPSIRLHLFLPCRDQASRWNDYSRRVYEYVLSNADEVSYSVDKYTSGCMLLRDRQLVEGADFCMAYCLRSEGGTAYTLNYANKKGLKTVNLGLMLNEKR